MNPSQVRQLHGHSPMALSLTPRALKCISEPIGELREAHCGQTVVGIDLDMSSCSMSYSINTTNPVESVELAPGRCTIPMVLLLRKLDGDNCMVESIGEKAREANYSLTSLSSAELSKFHYFELNLLLYRRKVSNVQWIVNIQNVVMRERERGREGGRKRERGRKEGRKAEMEEQREKEENEKNGEEKERGRQGRKGGREKTEVEGIQ